MKTFEERFTAWIDGQLTGAELAAFEKELEQHPEALEERDGALKLRSLLREHPTAPRLTNPDFFNLQLQQRIAAETRATETPVREKSRFGFWTLPRLAFAGAACLAVALALGQTLLPSKREAYKSPYFAQVVEAWPADPNISAITVYDPNEDVTVLWLDGLDYIPAANLASR